jgi:hypothetical protein
LGLNLTQFDGIVEENKELFKDGVSLFEIAKLAEENSIDLSKFLAEKTEDENSFYTVNSGDIYLTFNSNNSLVFTNEVKY